MLNMRLGRLHAGFSWRAFAQARCELSVERWPRVMRGVGYDLTIGCLQWWWYLAPLLLTACMHTIPPDSADREALDALEEAWGLAGLPDPGKCLERVEVRRHDTRADYVDVCEGLHPGIPGYRDAALKSNGCKTDAIQGVIGKHVVVINLAPGMHDRMDLIQHEALHALVSCALDRPATDPGDSQHSDVRIWYAASKDPAVNMASVEIRAQRN